LFDYRPLPEKLNHYLVLFCNPFLLSG